MKLTRLTLATACIGLTLMACEKDKLISSKKNPTMQLRNDDSAIEAFFAENRELHKQVFDVYAQEGAHITSAQGIEIFIPAGGLMNQDGTNIQGPVHVELIEGFTAGRMMVLNRTTEGRDQQAIEENGGDDVIAPMISGGEYFLRITNQQGEEVVAVQPVEVFVPTDLTGGADGGMAQWVGVDSPDQERDIVWEKVQDKVEIVDRGKEGGMASSFRILQNKWGWTNIDKFAGIPGPKTEVICYLPAGFDGTNAEVYMSFVGEPNALASLDRYLEPTPTTGYFSEHYGQINIGVEVNYIAVIEENGQIKSAIHDQVTVSTTPETFLYSEFSPTTQAQLETEIDALP